jgi:hypothetical protein
MANWSGEIDASNAPRYEIHIQWQDARLDEDGDEDAMSFSYDVRLPGLSCD